jgi:uncharacterized protein
MFGPLGLLVLVLFLASIGLQYYLKSVYARQSQVRNGRNLTGAEVARILLDQAGLQQVQVERVAGTLSDHYDPRAKAVRLSQGNFDEPSVAALAVAAHEVGHAIQDKEDMGILALRGNLLPVLNIGSTIAPWLIMAGFLLSFKLLLWVGILFFAGVVVFHLVTLPVEFDASKRALAKLEGQNFLSSAEMGGAREVLNVAALTYVAAFAIALVQLLDLVLQARRR